MAAAIYVYNIYSIYKYYVLACVETVEKNNTNRPVEYVPIILYIRYSNTLKYMRTSCTRTAESERGRD